MPPSLPRPPICTCAFTTQGKPTASAASTASGSVLAGRPSGTGIPWRAKSCLPWYSSRSMSPSGFGEDDEALREGLVDRLLGGGHRPPQDLLRRGAAFGPPAATPPRFS